MKSRKDTLRTEANKALTTWYTQVFSTIKRVLTIRFNGLLTISAVDGGWTLHSYQFN